MLFRVRLVPLQLGTTSLKPITISIPYDARTVAGSGGTFTVARLSNETDDSWELLPTRMTKTWVWIRRYVADAREQSGQREVNGYW